MTSQVGANAEERAHSGTRKCFRWENFNQNAVGSVVPE